MTEMIASLADGAVPPKSAVEICGMWRFPRTASPMRAQMKPLVMSMNIGMAATNRPMKESTRPD